jgi:hypothetical protein
MSEQDRSFLEGLAWGLVTAFVVTSIAASVAYNFTR